MDDYEQAPDTVSPSLWENTKNNHAYGLFEVCDGIYQVRGYDMANLTVIKGNTGWIVFDPLMSEECTRAAMQLIDKNLGSYPIKAVIISHPHVDHFGGILGVMSAEERADADLPLEKQLSGGKIPIIVPEGFAEHAIAENVYAGKAMEGNKARIHICGGEVYETRMTLGKLEEKLGENFIKVSRGCLVSVAEIQDITDTVRLSSGERLKYTQRQKRRIIDEVMKITASAPAEENF